MNETTRRLSGAEHTRAALLRAGLKLFGERGFEAASTRDIAAAANANIGSIAYHFGGKEGLYAACADHIVALISEVLESALGDVKAPQAAMPPREARAMLGQTLQAMAGFIVQRPEAGEIVQFLLRELTHPSAALDTIYAGIFEPAHKRLCILWEAATGEPAESERTKITVFTLIGQVIYFRIGRAAVLRRMGWSQIGMREAQSVMEVAGSNLAAILEARGRDEP
ncbi:CerR family C-terminal domain-containing protein [Chelativorans intermedius]|uniref:CerR family C-terminal domain-containing protein n=1 Tax=Chelativorans intermedius TaxID=515947 RepID=A0ABV6DD99_9HYPH|nr:CerR family C-terminal domain-containing protein [Chelativorans intermedius]MCT8998312.1 CerR family C-terminal domain-containing protein [Chelativorans intermedius]